MGTVTIKEQSAVSVSTPAVGEQRVFVDLADNILKTKDSGGIVRPSGVGTADELATTGAPVDVSGSAPPSTGNVLQATSPTTAVWTRGRPFSLTPVKVGPTTYTAAIGEMVPVNVAGGAVTVNLPAGHQINDMIGVKLVTVATNTTTVDPNGAETIDGSLTLVLAAAPINDFAWAIFISNGSNWLQIG